MVHVRISSTPLDLAIACNALTSTGFTRILTYGWHGYSEHTHGHWAWGLHPDNDSDRNKLEERVRAILGLEPDDLFIPPVHVNDKIYKRPVELIQRTIAEYTQDE